MTRRLAKEQLHQDINVWFADGIIEQRTLEVLKERYEAEQFGWIGIIRYIGITGGLLTFFGILGMIAGMAESQGVAALELAAVGAGLTYWGLRLSKNIREQYATSSKIIMTLGTVLWTASIGMFAELAGIPDEAILSYVGLISLPITFALAYGSRNTYLLILALLGLFHWIGAWNSMWGRSTYVFAVQDPRIMSLTALMAIAIGIYHEHYLYPQTGRFYKAWEALGLVYLNLSLLILSIWSDQPDGNLVLWVSIFTLACLAQIILGARLQNTLLRGYGITFLVIDIFTRYHELFWDRYSLGVYLSLGGGLLAAAGISLEAVTRLLRAKGGESV